MIPITYVINKNKKIPINGFDAKSMNFGILAPNESSKTNIIQLYVPDAVAITNIRLALIETGGIIFSGDIFGVETFNVVDYNIQPKSFFTGVSDKTVSSPYIVSIPSLNRYSSNYVYLNINVPKSQNFISGTVRYQWLFDYA